MFKRVVLYRNDGVVQKSWCLWVRQGGEQRWVRPRSRSRGSADMAAFSVWSSVESVAREIPRELTLNSPALLSLILSAHLLLEGEELKWRFWWVRCRRTLHFNVNLELLLLLSSASILGVTINNQSPPTSSNIWKVREHQQNPPCRHIISLPTGKNITFSTVLRLALFPIWPYIRNSTLCHTNVVKWGNPFARAVASSNSKRIIATLDWFHFLLHNEIDCIWHLFCLLNRENRYFNILIEYLFLSHSTLKISVWSLISICYPQTKMS